MRKYVVRHSGCSDANQVRIVRFGQLRGKLYAARPRTLKG